MDYTDHATQPAVLVEDSPAGEARWQSPDGSVSVSVNYGAARRKMTSPPGYDFSSHYETPTKPKEVDSIYSGPENFAPDAVGEEAPETMPLELSQYDGMPFKPWDNTPTPSLIEVDEEAIPTTPLARNIGEAARAMRRSPPDTPDPTRNRAAALMGGFAGPSPAEGHQSVIGAPNPQNLQSPGARLQSAPPPIMMRPPPQRGRISRPNIPAEPVIIAQPPAPAAYQHQAPAPAPQAYHNTAPQLHHHMPAPPAHPPHTPVGLPPTPPMLPEHQSYHPEEALSAQDMAYHRAQMAQHAPPAHAMPMESVPDHDPSGIFIADEYENAALQRSSLYIILGAFIMSVMGFGLMALLILAFFGQEIMAFMGLG